MKLVHIHPNPVAIDANRQFRKDLSELDWIDISSVLTGCYNPQILWASPICEDDHLRAKMKGVLDDQS